MYTETQGTLDNQTIAATMRACTEALGGADVPRRISMKATILLEELFLRYQEQLGPDAGFTLTITRRLGTLRVRIAVTGPRLNALDITSADDELGDVYDFVTVLTGSELEPPTYSYRRGCNYVTLSIRVQKQRPLWANPMLAATVLSIVCFLVLSRANAGLVGALVDDVVSPIVSMLMGVLAAITGPLLSVSLISGICALGDVATLKGAGRRAIVRIMAWVTVIFVASAAVSALFYHGATGQAATSFDAGELFELFLSAIPHNLFSPFVEGNSLQIAVESIFVGVCLLALGDRSEQIRRLVIELNSLTFKMMYLFSKTLPLLVGLSIFETLATTDAASLATLGTIVAINLLLVVMVSLAALLWVRLTLHVKASVFLRKAAPALFICLATGSSTSSMGEFFRISREEFGIDDNVVDFWVPLGHAMFAPSTIVPLVVGMFAVASMDGVAFNLTRMAILFILVFQLSIATPKVAGGIAATFTILLSQLGLSLDSVGILMAANVFVCNPEIAFGALIRFAEICSFAKAEHAIDTRREVP